MKAKTIIGLFIFIFSFSAHSQDVYIYSKNGNKIHFTKIDSIVQIKFKDGLNYSEKLAIARSINSEVDYSEISREQRICIPIDKNNLPDYKKLNSNNSLVYANQSLRYNDGTIQIPTEEVLARIKDGYEIKEILGKLNIEYENYRRIGHNVNSYLIILKNGESIETANFLYESGYFEHAQPSFLRLMMTSNTYYTNQWGLNNTGQSGGTAGIDINAPEAWGITEGYNNIVVAVLDQGVDLDHDDLEGNLLTGYDATDGSDGAVNGDCGGNYAHGTCCAGIIAAVDNTIGIKGVAPNCNIVSIRIGLTNNFYDPEIIEGMNYAWETADADIISCSFAGGSPNEDITDEISYALELGRDGLGCVVVIAAGNYNIDVEYPANCNPDIIAVGAINPWGERKSPTSSDGEQWYRYPPYNDYLGGSNYGNDLDIIAPGVFIPTTDIESSAGYNQSSGTGGDYYLTFNGTSAATPHVAGVAALVLSVNPNLTQDQVRDIIESTAQKVRTDIYTYSNHTGRSNGTWNNQMGYGLINAYGAIVAAAGGPISGSSSVCTSGTTFSISPPASFDSIHWNIGSNLNITSGQGTTSCTIAATGYGTSYVSVNVIANGHSVTVPQRTVYAALAVPPLYDISGSATIVRNSTEHYSVSLLPSQISTYAIFNYDWSITSRLQFQSSHSYQTDVYVKGITLGIGKVSFYTTNGCGTSTFDFPVRVVSGGMLSIYPNPASSEISIEIENDTKVDDTLNDISVSEQSTDTEYMVTIYDSSGVPVYTKIFSNNGIKINTSGLQKGIYYVTLMKGNEKYAGSFIIE